MDNSGDLRLLLDSRYPLIMAEERDEQRFLSLVREAAASLTLPVWTWSLTRGLARDGESPQNQTREPRKALAFVALLDAPGMFVFLDAGPALSDPADVRQVKEIAEAAKPGQTLILTSPTSDVPSELSGLALPWRLQSPSPRGAGRARPADDRPPRGPEPGGSPRRGRPPGPGRGRAGAIGLSGRAAHPAGRPEGRGAGRVRRFLPPNRQGRPPRFQPFAGDGPDGRDHGLGWRDGPAEGLAAAPREGAGARSGDIRPRASSGHPAHRRPGLRQVAPGQGRGQELGAALGAARSRPPVQQVPRGIGARLAAALKTAEAMAPAVVWIDEIEKGFSSGGEGDAGASRRLLGTFLRWMQDRPPGIFIVATANDVVALPPEFLRKGRFDEIFFVDLPRPEERREIFRLHLATRNRDPSGFDLQSLARASEGLSGAEIEAAVVGALYRAYAARSELTTEEVLAELRSSVPLSRTRAEEIGRLRAWAVGRAVPV